MTIPSNPTPETTELTPNTATETPETTESIMKATPELIPNTTPEVTPNTAPKAPESPEVTPNTNPELTSEASHEVTEQATLEITPEAFLQASTMVFPQATLQAALQYAARQWPVVPLYERDKNPLTPQGLKDASLDEQVIRSWWSQVPKANLGIRTGAKPDGAGVLVVDIDKDHGGLESLAKLEQEHGQLPATVEVITGGGGRHLYFRYPAGVQLKNSAGRLGAGLDTRGDGGYIVAPPSVHPCGRPYAWKEGHSPEEMTLAELPAWMVTLLTAKTQTNPEILPVRRIQAGPSGMPLSNLHTLLSIQNEDNHIQQALGAILRIKPREKENDGSRRLYAWACRTVEYDLSDENAIEIIRLAEQSMPFPRQYSDAEIQDRLSDAARDSRVERGSKLIRILDSAAPIPTANAIIKQQFIHQGMTTLYCQQNQFLYWTGSHYKIMPDAELRTLAYEFTQHAMTVVDDRYGQRIKPFNPDDTKVNKIIDALKAKVHLSNDAVIPSWLWTPANTPEPDPDPKKLIAMKNGLFNLGNGQLLPHTPRYLNLNAGDFDYVPQAPEPRLWLKFLNDLWGDDKESIRLLQQWFGYCLTCDTSQQKILLMDGPKRSGKGTICRVLTGILGEENVASPSLSALALNFGLWPLMDKSLATITDAHLSAKSDQTFIIDNLLAISGEDQITLDRKYKMPWTGNLNIRFMIGTNGLPKFMEASGALASRFLILKMVNTFINREDSQLTQTLLAELPGIFHWSVEGWRDLQQQGRFTVPESSLH